ncbi:hypothetical protein CMALT430_80189 [Carnobacterium maltaromaticum]|nr:hypothetical protein CMALT430_80189 [Carnobacterium maltaromaticum]
MKGFNAVLKITTGIYRGSKVSENSKVSLPLKIQNYLNLHP